MRIRPRTKALCALPPALTLLAAVLASAPAGARERAAPPVTPDRMLEAARLALAAGKPDDAAFILRGVPPGEANANELDFLHGTIAAARQDWLAAIDRFRSVLARNPNLLRVRLDLALSYFRTGDDDSAAYHFRQALGADDLPPAARARALAFLDEIRRRKSWWVTGSMAVAPDSNINAATGARLVDLFGLPAQLSDDARRTSGVGLSASVRGGYEARLSPDLRLRLDAGLHTRTYRQSQFNDRTVSIGAGPRILFDDFELRPRLTTRIRHLGGAAYSQAAGADIAGDWMAGPAWRVSASAGAERIRYESFLGAGILYSTGLGLAHALGQATLLRADGGMRREELDSAAHSWREYSVGLSVSQELPQGFVVSGGPFYSRRSYDAPQLIFGPEARKDRTLGGRVTVSSRRLDLFGFMPEITVRHEWRQSSIDLHDYTRTAAELGVVRAF